MGQTSTSPIGKQSKALGARLCAVAARASPQRHIRGRQGRRASSGRCGRQTGWQQHIRRHGSWCCGGRTADGHAALRRQPARISWCCGGSPAGRSWYCGGSTAVDHGAAAAARQGDLGTAAAVRRSITALRRQPGREILVLRRQYGGRSRCCGCSRRGNLGAAAAVRRGVLGRWLYPYYTGAKILGTAAAVQRL